MKAMAISIHIAVTSLTALITWACAANPTMLPGWACMLGVAIVTTLGILGMMSLNNEMDPYDWRFEPAMPLMSAVVGTTVGYMFGSGRYTGNSFDHIMLGIMALAWLVFAMFLRTHAPQASLPAN